jgi:hypothetical protein
MVVSLGQGARQSAEGPETGFLSGRIKVVSQRISLTFGPKKGLLIGQLPENRGGLTSLSWFVQDFTGLKWKTLHLGSAVGGREGQRVAPGLGGVQPGLGSRRQLGRAGQGGGGVS